MIQIDGEKEKKRTVMLPDKILKTKKQLKQECVSCFLVLGHLTLSSLLPESVSKPSVRGLRNWRWENDVPYRLRSRAPPALSLQTLSSSLNFAEQTLAVPSPSFLWDSGQPHSPPVTVLVLWTWPSFLWSPTSTVFCSTHWQDKSDKSLSTFGKTLLTSGRCVSPEGVNSWAIWSLRYDWQVPPLLLCQILGGFRNTEVLSCRTLMELWMFITTKVVLLCELATTVLPDGVFTDWLLGYFRNLRIKPGFSALELLTFWA